MDLQKKLLSLLNDKDYKSYLKLYCRDCISEFPQKSLKEIEKRDKVINIIEVKK